jgi:hypothetical protein
MASRPLLAYAMCVVSLACGRTEQTRSATESRMDADTAIRTVDSLAIRESGPGALVAEPPMADPTGKVPSGSVADLSIGAGVDTASGTRPRPIPAEPPAGGGSASTIRRLP